MAAPDSARPTVVEPEALAYARGLLKAPMPRDATWGAIGAGVLLAITALGLAVAMLTAPAPGSVEPAKRVEISR